MQKAYPRILYGRAVELINDQQLKQADELLTRLFALPNSAVTPYAHFWKGEIAYRNKEYDLAIRHLNFFLQANVPPAGEASKATANYNLGYSWLYKENYTKALGYFEQVARNVTVTSPAMEQDAYVRTADSYFMNSDFTKAKAMYDHVISNALPQSDYAMYQNALVAGVKSSTSKINTLSQMIRQYPSSSLVAEANMEIAQTYIDDEKFLQAVPYLTNVLNDPNAGGLKPTAYLKTGLAYYNADKYDDALTNYQALIDKYPQSSEANEATDIMKNIYIEIGKPNEYIEMMRKSGKSISTNEADSLTYTAAALKYNANDCNAALAGFKNYLSKFPNGAYALEANYFSAECYNTAKDYPNALAGYDYVNSKGLNRFFEKATLEAARISYFELKDYAKAKKYFESLTAGSTNQDNQLEALRGLVRTYYQLKDYAQANAAAKDLLTRKGLSTDDRSIAFLVLGKSQQVNNDCVSAIGSFKSAAAINKSSWGAEARYEIANCQFVTNNLPAAEKSALAVIKETGSYDHWVTKAYILLGDIFMQQKDYFNAKATYESVAKNSVIPELKSEAQQKLDKAIQEEKSVSKIEGN
jgi:TolA-binding protein